MRDRFYKAAFRAVMGSWPAYLRWEGGSGLHWKARGIIQFDRLRAAELEK